MPRHMPQAMKGRAYEAFRIAAGRHLPAGTHLEKVTFLGEGLHRKTWCGLFRRPDASLVEWVAQVPRPTCDDSDLDRFGRELELLGALEDRLQGVEVPRVVDCIEVAEVPVNLTTRCRGATVDMTGQLAEPARAAEVIGCVAAAVHAVDPGDLPVPGTRFDGCYEDAVSSIDEIRDLDALFIDDLVDWCLAHLPDEEEPSTLLHGDLLGQNVLWTFDGGLGLVDWELAGTGDPGADLAIVTRGSRRVFGSTRGTEMLLERYAEHADRPVTPGTLRLYELTLVAGEIMDAIASEPASAQFELRRLRKLFARPLVTLG